LEVATFRRYAQGLLEGVMVAWLRLPGMACLLLVFSAAQEQPLGDVARQARKNNNAASTHGVIYTNDNLGRSTTNPPAAAPGDKGERHREESKKHEEHGTQADAGARALQNQIIQEKRRVQQLQERVANL